MGCQLGKGAKMHKFVVYIHWSQTDHDHYLVSAKDKKDAERVIKEMLGGQFWIMGVSKISKDFS